MTHLDRNHASWCKSSFSAGDTCCVEVALKGSVVVVRDSKFRRKSLNNPEDEDVIVLPALEWDRFLSSVKGGNLDGSQALEVRMEGEMVVVRSVAESTELRFTLPEWQAFADGVRQGELSVAMLRERASVPEFL